MSHFNPSLGVLVNSGQLPLSRAEVKELLQQCVAHLEKTPEELCAVWNSQLQKLHPEMYDQYQCTDPAMMGD